MIRLALMMLLLPAWGTPPPRPTEEDGPRIEGFHALHVTPDAFADGLRPPGLPSTPGQPRPAPIVLLRPVLEALEAHSLTLADIAEQVGALDGVTEAVVDEDTVRIQLEVFRGLAREEIQTEDGKVTLGALGRLRTMPRPQDLPAPGPRSVVVFLMLDDDKLDGHGVSVDLRAEGIAALVGVVEVQAAPGGESVKVVLEQFRDLTTASIAIEGSEPMQVGHFGTLRTFPQHTGSRMPVPTGPARRPPLVPMPVMPPQMRRGHDLVVVNELGARVVVRIGELTVGELDPRATGVIHRVVAGRYAVVLEAPDGSRYPMDVSSQPRDQREP